MNFVPSMSPDFIKALFQGLATMKVRRSALAPFLTACLYITVPCLIIAIFCPESLRYWMLGLAAVPLVLFAVASMFLLFYDRDRLHTEEYLERRQALEIVESKGKGVLVAQVDLVNMVNPAPDVKKLTADTSEGEEGSNG